MTAKGEIIARRGTHNGTKDAVKKPTKRRISFVDDVEEWPYVIYGKPFVNCRPREIVSVVEWLHIRSAFFNLPYQ